MTTKPSRRMRDDKNSLEFINSKSCILHSDPSPSLRDLPGLTQDSIWSWLINYLGWHEPSLSNPIKFNTRKLFDSIPIYLRALLVRPDILPHRHNRLLPPHSRSSFNPNLLSVRLHYCSTAQLRRASIRNVHKFFRDKNRNKVERYPSGHKLWLPESELNWLKSRIGMRDEAEGRAIDFPISLRFTIKKHRQRRDPEPSSSDLLITGDGDGRKDDGDDDGRSKVDKEEEEEEGERIGQVRIMTLDERDQYWSIGFQKRSSSLNSNSINFSHSQPRLGLNLPDWLNQIGSSWIETGKFGPKNRVMFQKTCPDESVGILLWPKFPDELSRLETPRIPVYKFDLIELVDGDRLLIFIGPKRGLGDVVTEIEIKSLWASSIDDTRRYAPKKFVYPNPCERYPHCVRRPIYSPKILLDPEILEDLILPKSEFNPDQKEFVETFNKFHCKDADEDRSVSDPKSKGNNREVEKEERVEDEFEEEEKFKRESRVKETTNDVVEEGFTEEYVVEEPVEPTGRNFTEDDEHDGVRIELITIDGDDSGRNPKENDKDCVEPSSSLTTTTSSSSTSPPPERSKGNKENQIEEEREREHENKESEEKDEGDGRKIRRTSRKRSLENKVEDDGEPKKIEKSKRLRSGKEEEKKKKCLRESSEQKRSSPKPSIAPPSPSKSSSPSTRGSRSIRRFRSISSSSLSSSARKNPMVKVIIVKKRVRFENNLFNDEGCDERDCENEKKGSKGSDNGGPYLFSSSSSSSSSPSSSRIKVDGVDREILKGDEREDEEENETEKDDFDDEKKDKRKKKENLVVDEFKRKKKRDRFQEDAEEEEDDDDEKMMMKKGSSKDLDDDVLSNRRSSLNSKRSRTS